MGDYNCILKKVAILSVTANGIRPVIWIIQPLVIIIKSVMNTNSVNENAAYRKCGLHFYD